MTGLTEQDYMQLHAYFDGELTEAEASQLANEVAQNPELADELNELGLFHQAVEASFEATAAAIPQARFEQIWDEVERTLDADSRLQQAADASGSWWSRFGSLLRPFGIPAAAVGGVAAAFYLFVGSTPQPTPEVAENKVVEEASNGPVETAPVEALQEPEKAMASSSDTLAQKDDAPEPFPAPAPGVAEFERIDFGVSRGQVGMIEGKSGTVTVVFLHEDDDEPASGERTL